MKALIFHANLCTIERTYVGTLIKYIVISFISSYLSLKSRSYSVEGRGNVRCLRDRTYGCCDQFTNIILHKVSLATQVHANGHQINTYYIEPFPLLVCTPYFISCSINDGFTFITFIVYKQHWWCRHYLTSCFVDKLSTVSS